MRQQLVLAMAALAVPTITAAEPVSGRLMRQSDGSVLTYDCRASGLDRVTCDFVQVMFTRDDGTFPAGLDAAVEDALNSETGLVRASCPTLPLDEMRLAVETDEPLPTVPDTDLQALRDDPEGAGRFTIALIRLCEEKSREAAVNLASVAEQIGSITCHVSINRYSQTFARVEDDLWVTDSAPAGTCGVIDTSRFVGSLAGSDGTPILWDLEASKVITNPTGQDFLGINCSDLDQSSSTFTWKSGSSRLECMYVR